MKTVVIRTGGFALCFLLSLDVLCAVGFVYSIGGIAAAGSISPVEIVGLLILALVMAFLSAILLVSRIRLTEQSFTAQWIDSRSALPKKRSVSVALDDLQTVLIGNRKFLEGHLRKNESWKRESTEFYRQYVGGRHSRGAAARSVASAYTDVLVLLRRDGGVVLIGTKPFSAAGFRRLTAELSRRGMEVFVGNKALKR